MGENHVLPNQRGILMLPTQTQIQDDELYDFLLCFLSESPSTSVVQENTATPV